MNNIKRLILLLCIAFMLSFMAGCQKEVENEESNVVDNNIITISMSDEAKKYEEDVIRQDGVKTILNEENYLTVIIALLERDEQSFPKAPVTNTLEEMEYQGSKVYTLTRENYENIVLFTHGGGWIFGKSEEHVGFCDELCTRLNAKVYMPLYPLAPEADSDDTYSMIEGLYKEISKEGKKIYIMGDSAGGNITLGLMYTIKQQNLVKPEKMILIAPCTDMTFSNEEAIKINETDPELDIFGCSASAMIWAGEEYLTDPKNSALYADVSDYPDTMIFQGTNDILYPDNLLFYQHMKDAGVNVKLVIGEGFWHVFPIYPIPEMNTALELIEDFCK